MSFRRIQATLTLLVVFGLLTGVTGLASAQAAEAGIFEDIEVQPGVLFEVPVEVRNVVDLYALDIEIRFDPAILQAEDANPDQPGIQPALGTFLEAGLTLFNQVDNAQGLIRFAMSQVNPAEPVSGEGIVLVLLFVGQVEGESDLEVSFLEASDRFGDEIVLEPVDAAVTVSLDAAEIVATPIPTQDQGGMIIVPTLAPTTPATEVPPTPLPTPTEALAVEELADPDAETGETVLEPLEGEEAAEPVEAAEPGESAAAVEAAAGRGRSILDYWWAVLIVVLLAGGLGAYLIVSKRQAAS